MYRQRVAYSLGKLEPQRKKLLDDLGFPWETEPRSNTGGRENTVIAVHTTAIGPSRQNALEDPSAIAVANHRADYPATIPTHALQQFAPSQQQQQQEDAQPLLPNTVGEHQQSPGVIMAPLAQPPQQHQQFQDGTDTCSSTVHVNVRKRFPRGWVNGKRIKRLEESHHVLFSDGQEGYLSEEEFEVASFAYQNHWDRAVGRQQHPNQR
jgi:hypothetical protein